MGQARGLADLGLAIGKTIPKGADLTTIIKMIEDRVKGAAAAAAKADPWKVLTTQFQLMAEKLGTALLPAFTKLTDWLVKDGIPGLEKIGKWIGDHKGLFEALAATLAALWVAPKVDALIAVIGAIALAWDGVAASAGAAAVAEGTAEGGAAAGAAGAAGSALKKVGPVTKSIPAVAAGGLWVAFLKHIIDPIEKALPNLNSQMAGVGSGTQSSATTPLKTKIGSINSGLSPIMVPSTTKSKTAKKPTLSQLRNGNMGGGGALTLTVTTDSSSVVKSITGSAGNTKVVVKK
jgi:hypothetical protein